MPELITVWCRSASPAVRSVTTFGVGVGLGLGVGVGVLVGVGVGVFVGVGLGVGVDVAVGTAVGVLVAVDAVSFPTGFSACCVHAVRNSNARVNIVNKMICFFICLLPS